MTGSLAIGQHVHVVKKVETIFITFIKQAQEN